MTINPIRRNRATLALTLLFGLAVVLISGGPLQAQVINNPTVAEFDPPPDHWDTLDSGQPAVVRYELGVYVVGASAPFARIDMGKPAPDADGKVRYELAPGISNLSLPGGTYEARVSAVGPEGLAISDPSNQFTFTMHRDCTYSLTPSTLNVPAPGGSYTVDVATEPGCDWTASTSLSWVSMWMASGTGSGTVAVGVQANLATSSRSGTIAIGGQTLTVVQAAARIIPKTTPTTSWARPAPIRQGTPLGPAQLNATASVPGTFTYSPAAGTVLPAGTHSLRAAFVPADTTRYYNTTASTTITVNRLTYRLTISRPTGGNVTGSGLNCGTAGQACSVTKVAGTTLSLQAASDAGYIFSGWTGNCSGTSGSYTLQLTGPATCGATFKVGSATGDPATAASGEPMNLLPDDVGLPLGAPYTLTIVGSNGGGVRAAGINCGTTRKSCAVTMPGPMNIGLQATPESGYVFLGWTGHCSGGSPGYLLALEGARTCGADFIPAGGTVVHQPSAAGSTLPIGGPRTR